MTPMLDTLVYTPIKAKVVYLIPLQSEIVLQFF